MFDGVSDELEKVIRKTVAGRTVMRPASVGDLLIDIEYYVRITPDRDLLDGALRRLVEAGWIRQTSDGEFVDGRSAGGSAVHEPLSATTYRTLIDARRSREPESEEQPAPSVPVLIATIPTAAPEPTPEEWRRAERVAVVITDFLRVTRRRATVPFISSALGRLEFTVLGTVKDDPGKIHRLVASVFELAAPSGSELRPKTLDLP